MVPLFIYQARKVTVVGLGISLTGFLGKFRPSCNMGWHAGRDVPACRSMLQERQNLVPREVPRPSH